MADAGPPDTRTDEIGGRYARYVLGVLMVVYVFNFIDRQILSILAEEIKADLGITDAQIGFLYGTAFAVFYAVFGMPLGRLADVWVRKSLIAGGLAFWSLMTALSGTARSFLGLATFRFGVGVGEASATPAAFSMLSDYFSPARRATVLAVYSSGVYIGAGIGLLLGGFIVEAWRGLYPDAATAPFRLEPWQAAFFAVGVPGILAALWVRTLREPVRGISEGMVAPVHPNPFREAFKSLAAVLPPLTLIYLFRVGGRSAGAINIGAALVVCVTAAGLIAWLGNPTQWVALGVGVYATISWVHNLKLTDPAAFAMMFRSRAFVLATVGFPSISFVTYGVGFWSPPFMLRMHDVALSEAGFWLGGGAALGGWLGVTAGGIIADRLRAVTQNARIYVGLAVPVLSLPIGLGFLYTDTVWAAYVFSFMFSVFSPMWIGAAASTVNDLVLPRMRSSASAYYILMNTFIGLALGPYLIGQVSDSFMAGGVDPADALRSAMTWGLMVFGVSTAFLLAALRFLRADEDSRVERARALGEPVG